MQPAWRSLKGASHSDPIQVASSVFEQVQTRGLTVLPPVIDSTTWRFADMLRVQRASRARRALRRRSGELDTPPADGWGGQRCTCSSCRTAACLSIRQAEQGHVLVWYAGSL